LSARKKLNTIYFSAATLIALTLGIMSNSVAVFFVCLAVLTVGFLHDGSIRPDTPKHRRCR
jgi:hypothetical protein